MAEFAFKPMPHEAAMKLLADKPVVTRQVFDRLLPELQGRAFTMTGIEDAATLQRLKDTLGKLPEGRPWDEVKGDVLDEISPWIDAEQAPIRAELLMRHNGFQAYMAAKHENMSEMKDVMPYWQYITMEDEAVRDSHQALNGLVMPADSPFWADHTPPWDWGCRCEIVPLQPWEVDEIEAEQKEGDRGAENTRGWVPGRAEQREIEAGRVMLRPNMPVDVTAPRKREGRSRGTFGWNPGDLKIGLDELRERYDPDVFATFERFAKDTRLEDGRTVWAWLEGGQA
jgi:SPP1 gp7 family putative phage head morphogenesis protein